MELIQENGLVLIVHQGKRYLKKMEPRKGFHGKGGALEFSSLVGLPYGIRRGQYEIFEPTLEDIIMFGVRRETQIVYPKDACYICFKLNLKHGARVLEIGAGSGALSVLFSRAVGSEGTVVSIEKEERHYKNARKNIERFADVQNVDLRLEDVSDYEGGEFDAAFIDVREPWHFMEKVRGFLKNSGSLGIIVPTTNQVSETIRSLEPLFGDVEVLEILLRKYKTVADRLRPDDRMVAHTGYLIFARKIEPSVNSILIS
jgi:tRNA (adenine57-N1/adenine58-N1)-methyltransferase